MSEASTPGAGTFKPGDIVHWHNLPDMQGEVIAVRLDGCVLVEWEKCTQVFEQTNTLTLLDRPKPAATCVEDEYAELAAEVTEADVFEAAKAAKLCHVERAWLACAVNGMHGDGFGDLVTRKLIVTIQQQAADRDRYRAALEACRSFFAILDDVKAVEGPDGRYVEKLRLHHDLASYDVRAVLENKTVDDLFAEENARQKCPECGGDGTLGEAPDGRLIACEACGGPEDAEGSGYVSIS